MKKYLFHRLIVSVLTIWIVCTASFFLLRLLPGSPFATTEMLSVEMQHRMEAYYGLDKPWFAQYLSYMGNLLRGNLGYSYQYIGRSVNEIIANALPISVQLGYQALIVGFPLGILLGAIAAHQNGRLFDRITVMFSALGAAIPLFISGVLLQYVFAVKLGWFPSARWISFSSSILPTLTLAFGVAASKARTMRTMLMEVKNEEYIRAARARGIKERSILWHHEIRNALIPVLSTMGSEIASLLMGSFVVEQIYAIPGIGSYYAGAVANLDYPVVLGLTLFYTFFVVLFNLVIDTLYGLIDPRIRISG